MLKKIDKISGKKRISTFRVRHETSNEVVLQKIYKDFSKKCDFIKELYPFSGGDLHTYTRMMGLFSFEYQYYPTDEERECYTDSFEDCQKAFENGIFKVNRDFFGRGEWPIILFDRYRDDYHYDGIAYTITR